MQHPRPYSDTDPKVLAVWLNMLRKRSGEDKIAGVFDLMGFAREITEMGVRSRYPDASDREVFLRSAALYLSREQMICAYHWDPRGHEQPLQRI